MPVQEKTDTRRLPVSLDDKDNATLLRLKQQYELQDNRHYSIADVIRKAINVAAKAENV